MENWTNARPRLKPRSKREADIFKTLKDRYQFIKNLGEGSFSSVYAVLNRSLDRVEALKVLSDDLTREKDFLIRFTTEAKINASFSHPNIVTVYGYKKIKNYYYLTMFYIDGPPLSKFLKPPDSMPSRRVCTNIATVCDAAHYSHRRGVIHRDLKASNIILDQAGKPYVTDFGIAKWEKSLTRTQTSLTMGSPHYVSPEQAAGLDIDHRADIYALGVTLYALLTQRYPFAGDTPHLTIANRLSQDPIPPETYRPDLPPRLCDILGRALQKRRRDRYQTAIELATDLNDFVQSGASAKVKEKSVVPLSIEQTSADPKPSRSYRKRFITVFALLALVVAASLAYLPRTSYYPRLLEYYPGLREHYPRLSEYYSRFNDLLAGLLNGQSVPPSEPHGSTQENKKNAGKGIDGSYLIAPDTVHVGESINVQWSGPEGPYDAIQIYDPLANDGEGGVVRNISLTSGDRENHEVSLTVPGKAGKYRLRYWNDGSKVPLATRELTVTQGKVSIAAPDIVYLGEEIKVRWEGPNGYGDTIEIYDPLADDGEGAVVRDKSLTSGDVEMCKVSLSAPGKPGEYQLRYWNYVNKVVLATRELAVTNGKVSIVAPDRVHLGEEIKVQWEGPMGDRDAIEIYDPRADDGQGAVVRDKSLASGDVEQRMVSLFAPGNPGKYQLRYWNYANKVVLATRELKVTP